MAKDKRNINWKKLKNTIKSDVKPHVANLKKHNDELDALMVELYKVFQLNSSISMYKSYAGHIDLNHKWYKAFNKENTALEYVRIVK